MSLWSLAALVAAVICGTLVLRLGVPAGGMIGALIGVATVNLLTGKVYFPLEMKVFTQLLAGGFIGMSITLSVVRSLKTLVKPAVVLCCAMQLVGIGLGLLLYSFSGFNLATCLLSAAPGGMTDVTLVALDMGGDLSKIIVMHLVRLVSVICICPALNRLLVKRFAPAPPAAEMRQAAATVKAEAEKARPPQLFPADGTRYEKAWWLIRKNGITVAVAAVGGLFGYVLGIPAGVMVFSMAAVGAFNIFTGRGYMSRPVRRFAQMIAGAMIGQNIGIEEIVGMKTLILPALVLILAYMTASYLISFILYRFCGLDLMTALFASAPAGASDMAILAADLGGNSPVVAMMHVARLVTVIALFPQVTYFMLRIIGP